MKYYITTMGCQLNENDSEKLAGIVESMGFEKTEKLEEADLVIYNTCCVRENAEERLFGKLGELKKQKEEKGTIIAIILNKIELIYTTFEALLCTKGIFAVLIICIPIRFDTIL